MLTVLTMMMLVREHRVIMLISMMLVMGSGRRWIGLTLQVDNADDMMRGQVHSADTGHCEGQVHSADVADGEGALG